MLLSPRTNVRRVIFNAWPPFVKFLTVPIEMNFNHVPHFFILCCLYWINVSIRSLFFFVILRLSFGEFVNKILRNLTLPLRSVVRLLNIGALCISNNTAHVR